MPTSLIDIEIRVQPRQAAGYPVELVLDDQSSFRGVMPADFETFRAAATPEKQGAALFDALLGSREVFFGWGQGRGAQGRGATTCRVRLSIDPAAAELHRLPWELLRYDKEWIAAGPDT